MVSCPDYVTRRIHGEYPMINLVWNNQKSVFEYVETYTSKATTMTRVLGEYRNPDGSPTPLNTDKIMDWLHRADTRRWPMMDRLAAMRRDREEYRRKREEAAFDQANAMIMEDYSRIAGIPTFFMGPSMTAPRETHHPAIQRRMKLAGEA